MVSDVMVYAYLTMFAVFIVVAIGAVLYMRHEGKSELGEITVNKAEYQPDYPVKELWRLLQVNGDYGWGEYEDSGSHYYSFDFNGEKYHLITHGMLMFVESKSDNFNWMSAKDVNWLRNKIADKINKDERIKLKELRKKVGDDIMQQLKQTEEWL